MKNDIKSGFSNIHSAILLNFNLFNKWMSEENTLKPLLMFNIYLRHFKHLNEEGFITKFCKAKFYRAALALNICFKIASANYTDSNIAEDKQNPQPTK